MMINVNDEYYGIYSFHTRNVTLPREYLEYLFKSPSYDLFLTRILEFVGAILEEREEEMIKKLHRKGVI